MEHFIEAAMVSHSLFFFKKTVLWKDITCVRINEDSEDSSKTILLYDTGGTCVIDFLSSLTNCWCVVKMAEEKGIEIRQETDLGLKDISHL